MKLAHYQIEHIKAYVEDQGIWYYDVRDELVDHIASSVEDRMTQEKLSFSSAFAQSIETINCKRIQRRRMRTSTRAVHRLLLTEFLASFSKSRILVLITIFLGCYFLFGSVQDTQLLVRIFKTASISIIMLPLLLSLFDRQNRPYNYTGFISVFNSLFFYIIILNGAESQGSLAGLKLLPIFYPLYFTLVFSCIYMGFIIGFEQYQKIRKHATH